MKPLRRAALGGHLTPRRRIAIVRPIPVKLVDLRPKKSTIAPGMDAAIVSRAPRAEPTLLAEIRRQSAGRSACPGGGVAGRVETVALNGEPFTEQGRRRDRVAPRRGQHVPHNTCQFPN